jgi:hypothetical protein
VAGLSWLRAAASPLIDAADGRIGISLMNLALGDPQHL